MMEYFHNKPCSKPFKLVVIFFPLFSFNSNISIISSKDK